MGLLIILLQTILITQTIKLHQNHTLSDVNSLLSIDQEIQQSQQESQRIVQQLNNPDQQLFELPIIKQFQQEAEQIDQTLKSIKKEKLEMNHQFKQESQQFMIEQQKKHQQFLSEQLKEQQRFSKMKREKKDNHNHNSNRRLADDDDEDDEEEAARKELEAKIKAEAELRQAEIDKLKKERDEDKKARTTAEKQLLKVEGELEHAKTIFINSYDNQKRFIDSTEKHSQLLINQLGLMSQQIVDSEDRRDEDNRRKEEIELRKEFEKKIKDQMDRSLELQQKASEKVHGIEQMKNQVNALIQSMKYTVQRNKNLESRVLSLESIINAERSRRQITEANKPNLSELEQSCNEKYSCHSCTKDPQCGWCMSEQLCKAGDPVGPLMGSCVYWDYNGCSQGVCQGNTRCKGCIVNQECGWCEATKTCSEGSSIKPLMSCPFGYLHQDMKQPCDPDQKDMEQYIIQLQNEQDQKGKQDQQDQQDQQQSSNDNSSDDAEARRRRRL